MWSIWKMVLRAMITSFLDEVGIFMPWWRGKKEIHISSFKTDGWCHKEIHEDPSCWCLTDIYCWYVTSIIDAHGHFAQSARLKSLNGKKKRSVEAHIINNDKMNFHSFTHSVILCSIGVDTHLLWTHSLGTKHVCMTLYAAWRQWRTKWHNRMLSSGSAGGGQIS